MRSSLLSVSLQVNPRCTHKKTHPCPDGSLSFRQARKLAERIASFDPEQIQKGRVDEGRDSFFSQKVARRKSRLVLSQ